MTRYKPLATKDNKDKEPAANDPGLGDPIEEVLSQQNGQSQWHTPTIGIYHASQLPYCIHKQWRAYQPIQTNQEPPTKDTTSKTAMWLGTTIHQQLTDHILPRVQDAFTLIDTEKPCYQHAQIGGHEYLIAGKYDAIIKTPRDQLAILEIKTTKTLAYIQQRATPLEHHQLQVAHYMAATKIPRTIFYYWGIAEQRGLMLQHDYNENHNAQLRANAATLHAALHTGQEPDPAPQYEWECRYCQWRATCPGATLNQQYERATNKTSANTKSEREPTQGR